MKKLLLIFVALFSVVGTMPGFAAKRNIMELPIFERLVLIVKKYETMHDPWRDYPYVGYGHRVLPGEKYYRGYPMSEKEADALLRKDLQKFCAIYEKHGEDKYLLGALAYNCGPGVVNKSTVLKKLRNGDRNIYKEYTAHCHYKGKFHKMLNQRRITEYICLFVP